MIFVTNISSTSSSRDNFNYQYDFDYSSKDENEIVSFSRIQQPNILKKKLFFEHGWKEKSIFIPNITLALSTLIRLKKSSSKLQRLSLPSIAFILAKGYFFSKKLTEEIKNLDNQMHRITDEEYSPKKRRTLYVKKIEKVLQNIFLPSKNFL